MKESLLTKVSPETLDSLMNALTTAIHQMKDAEPVPSFRLRDAGYAVCSCFQQQVLAAIRKSSLKKQQEKETAPVRS
ncbi:uncharacterized protein BN666_01838 [Bacteroides sp. CAG:462]|nr:uncharacterized protein BN666_01838 [Bacteroides sp. CAG:462]